MNIAGYFFVGITTDLVDSPHQLQLQVSFEHSPTTYTIDYIVSDSHVRSWYTLDLKEQ